MKIQKEYFSDLSCYEEFVMKANLLGYNVSDKEVLDSLKKIEDYYVLFTDRIYMLDENGNAVEDAVIEGIFDCSFCNSLISLKGSPKKVYGSFICYNCNSLTSLKGSPIEVGGNFDCSYCNSLTSLEGSPKEVGGHFYCNNCSSLTSLEGGPIEIGGDFNCGDCLSLTSYETDTKIGGKLKT